MTATATQTTVDAYAITRAVGKAIPFSGIAIDDDNVVSVATATEGTVTAEPSSDGGWDVTVRDASGSLTPLAGVQSSYNYKKPELAARAIVLALLASIERAAEEVAAWS